MRLSVTRRNDRGEVARLAKLGPDHQALDGYQFLQIIRIKIAHPPCLGVGQVHEARLVRWDSTQTES